MNIGGAIKILETLDPKENSGILSKIGKELTTMTDLRKAIQQMMGGLSGLDGALGSLLSDVDKMNGAMKTKSKMSKEDKEAAKKQLSKLMKNWQSNRVKLLEQHISALEKQLTSLRKELATVKGSKPDGWFM